MRILRPGGDPEAFFARLRPAPRRVLLLDYDGTLAPFRQERDQAVPYPGVARVLERIMGGGGTRLVVVSGREVEGLLPLLGLEAPPEIWGTHGWERWQPGGRLERIPLPAGVRQGLERGRELETWGELQGRVENKPASVAVHVRGLPSGQAEPLLERVRSTWAALAENGTLEIHDFDGGVELRPGGRHKGTAVEEALAEEPAGAAVAYLGDDRTDEDAFRALSGRGLAVLVRGQLRETSADLWIRPPEELLDFLGRWEREAGS